MFGGGAATVGDAVQVFDGTGVARVVGRLPTPRADLAAADVGGRVVLVGGYDGRVTLPAVLATSDGTHFEEIARLPVPVRYPAVAVLDGQVYVFGGEASDGDTTAIQVVDLANRTARIAGQLPAPRAHAVAAVVSGTMFVIGGRVSGTTSASVDRYDPGTGSLMESARLPAPVSDAAVAVVGDAAYVVGGEDETPVASIAVLRAETA